MPKKWEQDIEEIFSELEARKQLRNELDARSPLMLRGRRHFSLPFSLTPKAWVIIFLVLAALLVMIVAGTVSRENSYTAKVPGPDCDQGGATWGGGNTHNENGIDVSDPYTSFRCLSNGLLITRTGDYNVFGDVFFQNQGNQPFPNDYRVQVTAQIVNSDGNASVDLSVHGQSHYGADSIVMSSNGQWSVEPFDDPTGQEETTLASGTLDKVPTTFTIIAEVHGASIAVTINGERVATVNDPNYSTTSFIGFGVSDTSATSNPSALFSNFVYTPL